ncbi:PIG-L family deacetylase [Brooklawnia cerclae]|uniref:N-acetyl-1-D-myo-inositol-2-amino-2-deoxy-alpha-D-glucopyranoside deacetylase n=1 Tax=Brooklawnia cerclae TaxID=349934 RepID=A0ABX0SN05_9ACTN|nr:PIG-L family deacetylase [Brooklawnia cerclae]NIH58151.1 N-acetyl-1-D-myo-inositol-2-amino-2-deoxy-alpha-D-glucopyranoside deacetylase [Brooklawnia cerclae]
MTDLLDLLSAGRGGTVWPLFVHAHPDDETLQSGLLIAWLAARQVACDVVTCTRGEQGEVVDGVLPPTITPDDLVRVRMRELTGALDKLGVAGRFMLGTPPARAGGLEARHYHDSGMRWVAPGLAGPADVDDPLAFTAAPLEEAVDDLLALIAETQPSVLVGYDRHGSYGHPDHRRAHEVAVAAARSSGVPMIEVASAEDAEGFEWFDLSAQLPVVIDALRCHATQLTVVDGDHIVHVGGQRQELPRKVGLRPLGDEN